MGKRKSAKQAPKRKKYVLPTEFDCNFCDHKSCVDVKLQRSQNKGTAKCRVCKKSFETGINHLHERADVYCAWMDAIDEQKKQENIEQNRVRITNNYDSVSNENKYKEDDDDDISKENQYKINDDDEDERSSVEERIRMRKIVKRKDRNAKIQKEKQKNIISSSDDDSLDDMIKDQLIHTIPGNSSLHNGHSNFTFIQANKQDE